MEFETALLTYSINAPFGFLTFLFCFVFAVGVTINLFSPIRENLHLGGQLCIHEAVSFKGLISTHFISVACTTAPYVWASQFISTEYTSLHIVETAEGSC